MRFIRQKHRYGCGIASLAMLTGLTYDQMLELVYPNRTPGSNLSAIQGAEHLGKIIQDVLGLKGKVIDPTKTSLSEIKVPTLVWLNDKHAGHLVVWNPEVGQIWDPDHGPSENLSGYEQLAFCYIKLSPQHKAVDKPSQRI